MLAKRIIPCLDVKNGKVVKGVRFRDHIIMGEILDLAEHYVTTGADELVFYDITASSENRLVDTEWVKQVAQRLDIPFCVAGGIRQLKDAEIILRAGADKISINSPALENPDFITQLAENFGRQCIVIGIDSIATTQGFQVCQYTGDEHKTIQTSRMTFEWIQEVQERGAGEIVLNCMNQDGVKQGYDIAQLQQMRVITSVPLIASGGAGKPEHFAQVFQQAHVEGALAASVFHSGMIEIQQLKVYLKDQGIEVRDDQR